MSDAAPISPARPDNAWLARYLAPTILAAAPYKIDTPSGVTTKLDQNESPWDWPLVIKERVAKILVDRPWNRYPSAFSDELAAKVAHYIGVNPDCVLLGPGSNYLCSLVLSVFSKGFLPPHKTDAKLVIARPSFPLYESHCRYEGIPYEPWLLNDDLEYEVERLPKLAPGSMVIFASPNNPVGNVLPKKSLARLLSDHPETLFVADEAYFEYTSEQYTDLLQTHANLMLVRTFSKTLGCAGVRVGYVVAHPAYLDVLKKLRLPYLLNHFSIAAAEAILTDSATKDYLETTRKNAVTQRQLVYDGLSKVAARGGFFVKNSEANFLLLRWPTQDAAIKAYQRLIEAGILVRNVSGGPGLAGCLRITLGDAKENAALLAAFQGPVLA